ncbi:hypothetical protein N7507_004932 [Penicillium longicatenatum]|nr:hypothetical protein N7507_004932 [Penicillium longicatenatum]
MENTKILGLTSEQLHHDAISPFNTAGPWQNDDLDNLPLTMIQRRIPQCPLYSKETNRDFSRPGRIQPSLAPRYKLNYMFWGVLAERVSHSVVNTLDNYRKCSKELTLRDLKCQDPLLELTIKD